MNSPPRISPLKYSNSPMRTPNRKKSVLRGWFPALMFCIFLIVWIFILMSVIHTNKSMEEAPIDNIPDTHQHIIKGVVDLDEHSTLSLSKKKISEQPITLSSSSKSNVL